jgi:hypothetical protein
MTHLERRLARLEATHGNADVLVECALSDEGKQLLREVLTGLHSPEEIERIVSTKVLGPRGELSPAAREQLEEVIAALGAPLP